MAGFLRRIFGARGSAPEADLPALHPRLGRALAAYVECCLGHIAAEAAGRAVALRTAALVREGVETKEALVRAMLAFKASGDVPIAVHRLSLDIFLMELVTAILDALEVEDRRLRSTLLRAISPASGQQARLDDLAALESMMANHEGMILPQGWRGPLQPDEALDEWVIPFWAGNQAARDFLAKPWRGAAPVEPDPAVGKLVAQAVGRVDDGGDLPETPLLSEQQLLRRRRPELWQVPLDRPIVGNPNATAAQLEAAALAWLEALRGDGLTQALLWQPRETALRGLDRVTPPLGVALVDFVLRAQYQVRPAFKASARPVLQGLARRLSGGEAEATVERWIRLWKDLMLAYGGQRPESLRDERRYALLAYGQTRGRQIGGSYRDALEEGALADWAPASRDVELGALLWRLAAPLAWDEGDCLDWPLDDRDRRLAAAEAGARDLLRAAGISAPLLAAWEAGDAGRGTLRALLGYGAGLFVHPELMTLELLPLLARQGNVMPGQALEGASYSRAAAEGEVEGLALGLIAAASAAAGLEPADAAAVGRLLLDSANLPGRSGNRLMDRLSHLASETKAERPKLPVPALPDPPPSLVGSEILRGYDHGGRAGILLYLTAALAADLTARLAVGEALPQPAPEAIALVDSLLVYDPGKVDAHFRALVGL